MVSKILIVSLLLVSGALWWKLSRAQHSNDTLVAEIARLRLKLRGLRS